MPGATWFYYGSRYGEYLGVTRQGNPEDYLPAVLEESPANRFGISDGGEDYYADSGDTARAITDYKHTLELAPGRADVYDSMALAYFKQGARAEAIAQWKHAFAILLQQVNRARVPETFWGDFGRTCDQLHAHGVFTILKPDADAILRTYLRRNGNYRSNAVIYSAYTAVGESGAGNEVGFSILRRLPRIRPPCWPCWTWWSCHWIPLAQRGPIYQRIMEIKQDAVSKAEELQKENAEAEFRLWQDRWVRHLVRMRQYKQAGRCDRVDSRRDARDADAAKSWSRSEIASCRQSRDGSRFQDRCLPRRPAIGARPGCVLRAAARQMFDAGDKQSARKVLEFVFAREIDQHNLVAANFLGLAEIRIAAGDVPSAVDLLRRLVIVVLGIPMREFLTPAGGPFGEDRSQRRGD